MTKNLFIAFISICLSTGLYADQIMTTTGDVIKGTVVGIKGGKVSIKTAFAGTLAIDRALIQKIDYSSDASVYVRTDATLRDKTEVRITHDAAGNVVLLPATDKQKALSLNEVSTLWGIAEEDPDFPPIKLWAFSTSLGLTGHSGASDDISFSAYIDAVRTTEHTTLKLYASMNKTRSEGVKTAEQYIAGLDFEHRPAERWSWYVRDEMQHNAFSDYKLRNVLGVGGGYYLWKTNTDGRASYLRLRLGIAQTHTERYTKKDHSDNNIVENDLAFDIGLLFHHDFACGLGWNTEITYTPIIDDLERGTVVHESKATYLMKELGLVNDKLSDVALELGMRNEFQMGSDADTETDTMWYLRLSKSW